MAIRSKVVGLHAVQMKISRWLKKQEMDATLVARGLAAAKLAALIKASPQYSGDFAANWNYGINKVDKSYDEDQVYENPDRPYQQGDRPAISLGLIKNVGKDNGLKLGDTVYISNFSTHTDFGVTDEYYQRILDGTIKLRDVNLKITIRAAMMEYNERYDKRLVSYQLGALKRKRAGEP